MPEHTATSPSSSSGSSEASRERRSSRSSSSSGSREGSRSSSSGSSSGRESRSGSSSSSGRSSSSRSGSSGSSGSSRSGSSSSSSSSSSRSSSSTLEKGSGAAEAVAVRNRFFYVFYRRQLAVFMMALVLCVVSLVSAFYFGARKTPPQYLAATADGRVLQTYPLDQPSLPGPLMDAAVTQWALDGTKKLYTFDYINYRDQIEGTANYFTVRGWKEYLSHLGESKLLDTVRNSMFIAHMEPVQAPQIVARDIVNIGGVNRMRWLVKFPIVVRYVTSKANSSGLIQRGMVQMYVMRVALTDSPKGIAIDQFVFQVTNP